MLWGNSYFKAHRMFELIYMCSYSLVSLMSGFGHFKNHCQRYWQKAGFNMNLWNLQILGVRFTLLLSTWMKHTNENQTRVNLELFMW